MGTLIAVVGSADATRTYKPPLTGAETVPRAGEQLGRALADAGCDLMVYSSEAQFVEDSVVTGYLSHDGVRDGSVHVRPPYMDGETDFPLLAERPEVFDLRFETGDDWEVAFYRSLREVHGVVLIGGNRSTLVTGLVCLTFGVPVVPVACFGGAARRVWDVMNRVPHHATADEVSAMGAEWHADLAPRLVRLLLAQQQRKTAEERAQTRARRGAVWRSALGITVGLVLLCLGLGMVPLAYAVDSNATVNLTTLIVGALTTGAAGAITRNTFDHGESWARTAALGMSAGAVAFLLFVSAQLAASPGMLAEEGARRLLFFVLTVGFVSGFTFDAVYDRLKQTEPAAPQAPGPHTPVPQVPPSDPPQGA
ncbi:hypothetical protein [Streptomyces sp. B93]|uniref:hypothetical protein n=1 Tax=Streptomyces sp. B93 TaxID=2824875 RepID=UPI001FFD527A|nr:hypothetical protein [Streptomyces sp. B93]